MAISRAIFACVPAIISFSSIIPSIINITTDTPTAFASIIGKYIFLMISHAISLSVFIIIIRSILRFSTINPPIKPYIYLFFPLAFLCRYAERYPPRIVAIEQGTVVNCPV